MQTIAENLNEAMGKGSPTNKLGVIVTTNGPEPEGFGLQSFDGLDGLFHGQLTHDEINQLSKHPNVKAVELDSENTILGN